MKIQHWKKVNTIIDKHNWERSHSIDNIMPFYFLKRHHQSQFILNILKELVMFVVSLRSCYINQ
jgi:hypothetical protein